jgi:hypothetical protein
LIPDKIFMGAATDVESMVKTEGIDVIVGLRGEAAECAYPDDAEAKAKSIRNIHRYAPRRESFHKLYPGK